MKAWIHSIFDFLLIYRTILAQKKHIRKTWSDKTIFPPTNADIFTKKEFEKINYYALYIHLALLQPFAFFSGRHPDEKEIRLQILLSICAAIQDELEDHPHSENQKLKTDLLKELLKTLRENVAQSALFERYLPLIDAAQKESKKQNNPSITLEELKTITYNKSAYACFLVRALLQEKMLPGEEEAIYQYGGVIQLGDDILDILDDVNSNIHTLANRMDEQLLQVLLNNEIRKTITLFEGLDYPLKNKSKAIKRIKLFLAVFELAIENLLQNKVQSNRWDKIKSMNRSQLILDMETFKNKFHLLKKVSRYYSLK